MNLGARQPRTPRGEPKFHRFWIVKPTLRSPGLESLGEEGDLDPEGDALPATTKGDWRPVTGSDLQLEIAELTGELMDFGRV
jgi:hypothetical protein